MKTMQIKLRADYRTSSDNPEHQKWVKDNAGKWVDAETEYLFTDQYNTKFLRLYDRDITAVRNDARENKGTCGYCGTLTHVSHVACLQHGECAQYGMKWFTPENTFFLRYPNGLRSTISETICKRIGTYWLTREKGAEYFELRNLRKRFRFKYDGEKFYVMNGIGYKQSRFLDVPDMVMNKVKKELGGLMRA